MGASVNEGGDDDNEDVDWKEGDDAGGKPLAEDRDSPVPKDGRNGSRDYPPSPLLT